MEIEDIRIQKTERSEFGRFMNTMKREIQNLKMNNENQGDLN
jgi:hypothetical protein